MYKSFIYIISLVIIVLNSSVFAMEKGSDSYNNNIKMSLVQISDSNINDFYLNLKLHNLAKKTNLNFSSISQMQVSESSDFEPYIVLVKSNDNTEPCALAIFTNRAGFVSKIMINTDYNSKKAMNTACKLEYVLLGTLGIDDIIARDFIDDIWRNSVPPFKIAVWNERTNRNIIVEHGPSFTSASLFQIRMTAVNRKFN